MEIKKTDIKNKVVKICSTCKIEFNPIIRKHGLYYKCCNKCLFKRKHKKMFCITIQHNVPICPFKTIEKNNTES